METDKEIFEKTMELEKKKHKQWYHTIDFGNGEITDGIYNHRPLLKYYGFPESLKEKRVLDVGCADGFFSFLFEKKGAVQVIALDAYKSDLFLVAKEKLNSKVEYSIMDVYDLSPERNGYFDFVFCGTVLIHLTDPIKALRNIRSVIRNGEFICASPVFTHFFGRNFTIARLASGRPTIGNVPAYWLPTEKCLREMIYKAGFDSIEKVSNFTLQGYSKATHRKEIHPHAVFRMKVGREG